MRILKVQGKGRVNAEPDLITLSFGVETKAKDYEDCLRSLNARTEGLRASMTVAEIDRTELKTTNFNVRVETHRNSKTGQYIFEGYRASHNLQIELPVDKQLLNQLIRCVSQSNSGAEIDLAFSVKDKDSLRKRALTEAVKVAKQNAETLATAAGEILGKLQQIDYGWSEVRFSNRVASMVCESYASSPPMGYGADIEPQDIVAEDNVTLIYEIAD
jgi:uncharacterized protein YggE